MTMIALEQARQHLETLGLKQAVEVLDNTLDAAANKQLTYADVLAQLLGAEVDPPMRVAATVDRLDAGEDLIDGGPAQSQGRAQPGPQDAHRTWPPRCSTHRRGHQHYKSGRATAFFTLIHNPHF